jgi:hypothetical protein
MSRSARSSARTSGGVAAAACAAKKGYLETGRDVGPPLANTLVAVRLIAVGAVA